MFQLHPNDREGRVFRLFAACLAVLSTLSLTITAWILFDFRREQEILSRIIGHLPESDVAVAQELSVDLRVQNGLSTLLVINLIGTAIAIALVLWRYASSERSLRDVKVLATDILASMDAGVITTDREGRMTSINPRGIELVGGENFALGEPLASLGNHHGLLVDVCDSVMRDHHGIRDRDYVVSQEGHRQTLRTSCTLLRNQRDIEIGTVIQVRDVSERALIEERLRRMERYIGLGALASGLHHEIKNPLSALLLHIQLLAERVATLPPDPQLDETLDVLQTEVKRINDVLDGFRNYAALEQLGRGPVEVPVILRKLVRLLRPEAERHAINLVIKVDESQGIHLEADSIRLEQVLLNLALNGMAAMRDGGTLTFEVSSKSEQVQINVIDTGKGIAPEIQSKIFDPYFTTKSDGTGMGLALCEKIVRQHGGSIEFQTGSEGTTFSVILPLEPRE